jgi:hypothetical protein
MTDRSKVDALLAVARDKGRLQAAQRVAGQRLLAYDGTVYPKDGCAITLSVLMQEAGIAIRDIFWALEITNELKARGWQMVPNAERRPGDIGTTCVDVPMHGDDHVYLVLDNTDADGMVIADNQATEPHPRWISGKGGKTPTKYFLRAV